MSSPVAVPVLTEQMRQEIAELEWRYQRSLLRSPGWQLALLALLVRRDK